MDDLDDETRNRDIGFVRVRQGRSSLPPPLFTELGGEAGKVSGETVWSFQLKGKTEVERKRSVGKGVEFFLKTCSATFLCQNWNAVCAEKVGCLFKEGRSCLPWLIRPEARFFFVSRYWVPSSCAGFRKWPGFSRYRQYKMLTATDF